MNEFWDIAYRDNAPALLGVLRRYVKETDIAQDLLQEVFITAIGKYDGYSGKGSFEGWLYKIAVNTALMHLRNENNKPATLEIDAADVDTLRATSLNDDDYGDTEPVSIRAIVEAAEFSSEELLLAIDQLPEHHRWVFNMYVMDGFSHRQIAQELNISAGTSKSHLKRARKKVQQILYEKAMNKNKKKDKRRLAGVFLMFFPAREHYIDRLYREGLSDLKIPPTAGGGEFIATVVEQHSASMASQQAMQLATQSASFLGGKISYLAACGGTAAVTASMCWLTMSVDSPLNSRDEARPVFKIETIDTTDTMDETDTINIIDTLDATDMIDLTDTIDVIDGARPVSTTTNETDTEPVVVRRQIIEHQTVVVRDTVFIIEN